ncbi:hypothetical protein BDD12DRAFT_832113 [Trichophaea hybrida]|nr:hypothetical protein BDD12DRAFT_832113 [Trichophaea hybrida]
MILIAPMICLSKISAPQESLHLHLQNGGLEEKKSVDKHTQLRMHGYRRAQVGLTGKEASLSQLSKTPG